MTLRACRVLLAAALVAGCASTTPNMRTEAKARMEMGVNYLRQNNSPAAMKELTRAEELDPDNPEIAMVLGLAYQARGDYKKAEKYLRRAIDIKPDYSEAHNNLGYLMSLRGRSKEAIREYETAVRNVLYQTPEVGYTNMAEEYRRLKDPKKAEEMYRRAISFNAGYPAAYRGLATLQTENNLWSDAAKTLGQCTASAPEFWPCWMDLGSVQLRLGKNNEAQASFRQVLSGSTDPALRAKAAEYVNLLQRRSR
ncbi:MAG: tetratricopeptide repeat protein [Gemmatimonadota bacterium]